MNDEEERRVAILAARRKRQLAGQKASATKGKERERDAGKAAAWTREHPGEDPLKNPYLSKKTKQKIKEKAELERFFVKSPDMTFALIWAPREVVIDVVVLDEEEDRETVVIRPKVEEVVV